MKNRLKSGSRSAEIHFSLSFWYTVLMFLIPDEWYALKSTKKKGRGAFALRDIPQGTLIGDYLGTIIPCDSGNELMNGLYDMMGGSRYDILASPLKNGIQMINHACANNCDLFPYRGHMLYFAARKIFKGEELTVDYGLHAPDDTAISCDRHACYCGTRFCTGTMHNLSKDSTAWENLVTKEFGTEMNKLPGNYGDELQPLAEYPKPITKDYPKIYNIFGSENRPALTCADATLPSVAELRKRIRTTGRRLAFPKLHLMLSGVKEGTLLMERIGS